jgi:hypothetical protein
MTEDEWVETTDCPEHAGAQRVIGEGATQGPDPYSILHLECGHSVICMGPGDPNHIIGTHGRISK